MVNETFQDAAMSPDRQTEEMQALMETLGVVDANAQLLLVKVRASSLKARQLEASLALLVGLLVNSPELTGEHLINQISNQLTLCAKAPEMAAQVVGCDTDLINPAILLAAAGVLAGGDREPVPVSPAQVVH
jgi:hypothetical protein